MAYYVGVLRTPTKLIVIDCPQVSFIADKLHLCLIHRLITSLHFLSPPLPLHLHHYTISVKPAPLPLPLPSLFLSPLSTADARCQYPLVFGVRQPLDPKRSTTHDRSGPATLPPGPKPPASTALHGAAPWIPSHRVPVSAVPTASRGLPSGRRAAAPTGQSARAPPPQGPTAAARRGTPAAVTLPVPPPAQSRPAVRARFACTGHIRTGRAPSGPAGLQVRVPGREPGRGPADQPVPVTGVGSGTGLRRWWCVE